MRSTLAIIKGHAISLFRRVTREQLDVLRTVVDKRHAHDLGAGTCELSLLLLYCGATGVTAVDEQFWRYSIGPVAEIEMIELTFEAYARQTPAIDVAFISWPNNRSEPSLVQLIKRANTIIYLGSNMNGSASGGPELFEHFLSRELLAHEPNRRNTLLVLGKPLANNREPTPEERAAISSWHGGKIEYCD